MVTTKSSNEVHIVVNKEIRAKLNFIKAKYRFKSLNETIDMLVYTWEKYNFKEKPQQVYKEKI